MPFEVIVIWLAIAVFTGAIAHSRGRDGFGWFLLGLIFSLVAMIAVACMPVRRRDGGRIRVDKRR